jgi:hypothetical protein
VGLSLPVSGHVTAWVAGVMQKARSHLTLIERIFKTCRPLSGMTRFITKREIKLKKFLTLTVLSLLATVVVSEAVLAAKCSPGKRYYNGRCV